MKFATLWYISSLVAVTCSGLDGSDSLPTIPLFLWTEVPNKDLKTVQSWKSYYQRMLRFILSNRLMMETNGLVLCILPPTYKTEGLAIWGGAVSESPMYTELISHIPDNVALKFYPYIGEEDAQLEFAALSSSGDPLEGVYALATRWNKEMAALGSTKAFTGIVLDFEGFGDFEEFGEAVNLSEISIAHYKETYQIPEISLALKLANMEAFYKFRPFIDTFYMEAYDIFTRGAKGITKTSETSPYSLNPENPEAVVDFLRDFVFYDPALMEMYNNFGDQIFIMWSTQNAESSQCLYPLRGMGGANCELGTWSPAVANKFLRLAMNPASGLFPNVRGHGIFQFDLIPLSWEW